MKKRGELMNSLRDRIIKAESEAAQSGRIEISIEELRNYRYELEALFESVHLLESKRTEAGVDYKDKTCAQCGHMCSERRPSMTERGRKRNLTRMYYQCSEGLMVVHGSQHACRRFVAKGGEQA